MGLDKPGQVGNRGSGPRNAIWPAKPTVKTVVVIGMIVKMVSLTYHRFLT